MSISPFNFTSNLSWHAIILHGPCVISTTNVLICSNRSFLETTTAQLKIATKFLHSQKSPLTKLWIHSLMGASSKFFQLQLQLHIPNLGSNKLKQLLKRAKKLMFFASTLCSPIRNGIIAPPIDKEPKEIHNTMHDSNYLNTEPLPLTKVCGWYSVTFLDQIP